jgi:DnaJ-class molecular chaperone
VMHTGTCDVCKGTGAKPGTTSKTCTHCHGTGQISQARRTPFGQFITSTPCPHCSGTGKIIESPCSSCNGRGRVRRPRTLSIRIPAGIGSGDRIPHRGEGDAGVRGGPPGDLYIFVHIDPHPCRHSFRFDPPSARQGDAKTPRARERRPTRESRGRCSNTPLRTGTGTAFGKVKDAFV